MPRGGAGERRPAWGPWSGGTAIRFSALAHVLTQMAAGGVSKVGVFAENQLLLGGKGYRISFSETPMAIKSSTGL